MNRPSSIPLILTFVAGSLLLAWCAGIAYVDRSVAGVPWWLIGIFSLYSAVMALMGAFAAGD